ncbi:MAG: pilus assembly protein TadG [Sphingomonadales bacterium]|nr:pilus assembly protein TadG [Sphingomonadales bacterium]
MSSLPVLAFVRERLMRLAGDPAGSMLPLAAGGLIVILALVGGGVDISRVYKVQNRLQAACDAGVLAGRKAVTTNGFDTAAQTQASKYFNVNFDTAQQQVTSASFTPSTPDNGTTVVGAATANVQMVVMEIFGRNSMPVTANCKAQEGISNIDVTFVLDTTGSMGTILTGTTTRLQALKNAAKNFFTTVQTSTSGTTARVRYAFVPFSAGVNVGNLVYALNPNFLANTTTIQSRMPQYDATTLAYFQGNTTTAYMYSQQTYAPSGYNSSVGQYGSTNYASMPACQAALPADSAWTAYGSVTTTTTNNVQINSGTTYVTVTKTSQPQKKTYYFCDRATNAYIIQTYYGTRTNDNYAYGSLVPTSTSASTTWDHFDFRPVLYDLTAYKAGGTLTAYTGNSGAAVSSTWDGCIEERFTRNDATFTFNASTGRIENTGASDLDIDAAPSTTDDATKWLPAVSSVAYYRTSGSSGSGGLTDPYPLSTGGYQASYYCPTAATTLAAMSQTSFNSYVDGLVATGNTYHDYGMLWGARISSPTGPWSALVSAEPSNHQTVTHHLILETDGEPNATYTDYTTYGIEYNDRRLTTNSTPDINAVHVNRMRAICDALKARGVRIWVIALATSLTADLTYCASSNSAYTATSAGGLDSAFQSIAKQVGELRVTQ